MKLLTSLFLKNEEGVFLNCHTLVHYKINILQLKLIYLLNFKYYQSLDDNK